MGAHFPRGALISRKSNQEAPLFARKHLADKESLQEPEKKKETLPESILGLVAVLVSALFIITFVVQSFVIPSASMENTLQIGDYLLVDRLAPAPKANYLGPLMPYREIQRGDIVVFVHPDPAEKGMYVVKRVIGIPHDRVRLRNGVVYRNGEALNEPYVLRKQGTHDDYRDEFPRFSPVRQQGVPAWWPLLKSTNTQDEDLVIPEGDYFAMGDNREQSLDSRYWGFIPRENIIGRPMFVYWSFQTAPDEIQRTTWGERGERWLHMVIHFFDETRWSRMFHRVH
jgi:signal peptidase I